MSSAGDRVARLERRLAARTRTITIVFPDWLKAIQPQDVGEPVDATQGASERSSTAPRCSACDSVLPSRAKDCQHCGAPVEERAR